MRVVNVKINGKEYPAAFTVRVLADLEDRSDGKTATEALRDISNSGHVRDAAWMLAQLLKAGARLTENAETPPDENELLDLIDGDDAFTLCGKALSDLRQFETRVQLDKEAGDDEGNAPAAL